MKITKEIWFAWYPVKTEAGWTWLEYVYREIRTELRPMLRFLGDEEYRKTCMTLKEVGIVIGKKLLTRRRVIRSKPVYVYFESTELKDRRMLISSFGEGKNAKEAKADYCKKIKGQLLITDAMLKTRKEIQLPPKITVK